MILKYLIINKNTYYHITKILTVKIRRDEYFYNKI